MNRPWKFNNIDKWPTERDVCLRMLLSNLIEVEVEEYRWPYNNHLIPSVYLSKYCIWVDFNTSYQILMKLSTDSYNHGIVNMWFMHDS